MELNRKGSSEGFSIKTGVESDLKSVGPPSFVSPFRNLVSGEEGSCLCLSQEAQFRPPPRQEFGVVFEENVVQLVEQGELKSVDGIESVQDVPASEKTLPSFDCNAPPLTFLTEVDVELSGDPSKVTNEELLELSLVSDPTTMD